MILKYLWLHLIRSYIRLGLFFYYKKIKLVHLDRVPKKGAVIFLGNHQNALMDALLIASKCGRFTYFLTRASVFKNPIFSRILKSLLMLPVYRIRDGWQNISKNKAIFETSAQLVGNGNAISLFPEGSHHINRTVRPLSKGFTRIVFETLEQYPNTDMHLVPVGLNFVHAEKFGDSVSMNFGTPIKITSEITNDKAKSIDALKLAVSNSLCKLTTHIEPDGYEKTLKQLEDLNVDFLNPEAVNRCIASDFKNCEPNRQSDFSILKRFFKFWLIIALLVPYLVWKLAIETKIKEIEFVGTFRFVVVITLVPIYILCLTAILFLLFSMKLALWYILIVFVLAILAIKL